MLSLRILIEEVASVASDLSDEPGEDDAGLCQQRRPREAHLPRKLHQRRRHKHRQRQTQTRKLIMNMLVCF
jgi:hypothetical protein